MDKPTVTIITPAYMCKDSIAKTFNSVIAQTFESWEWIIVDACSDDGTYEYIKSLIDNDHRIVLLKTAKNGGSAAARNVGIKASQGRYITFLDSDDLLDNNYLESQLLFMEKHGPIITSGYRRQTDNSCVDFIPRKTINYKGELKGNDLSCLTTMYDKETIGDRLFPENIRKREDYVFWLDILKDGFVAYGNDTILATYVIHKGSKSSNKFKLIKYNFYVYHKTQKINWFKSWLLVIQWIFYGLKKYKGVK